MLKKNRSNTNFYKKKIFDDKMEIIIPINFNEKNSDLILAKKRWIFNENLRSEFYLKKKIKTKMSFKERISNQILLWKRMIFKGRISDLIFDYEKEWVLKKEFHIWFLIMKKNDF